MVTIEVTNANSKVKVLITWRGYTHSEGWTDNSGRVSFDVSPGTGSIHIDGKEVLSDKWLEGTVRVSK